MSNCNNKRKVIYSINQYLEKKNDELKRDLNRTFKQTNNERLHVWGAENVTITITEKEKLFLSWEAHEVKFDSFIRTYHSATHQNISYLERNHEFD